MMMLAVLVLVARLEAMLALLVALVAGRRAGGN